MTKLQEAAQQALDAFDSMYGRKPERVEKVITALRAALAADSRICTCHPDDNPPKPCQRKYALSECREAALAEDAMQRLTDEQQMIERGTKAWADVPDATAWVDEMRGNIPAPTGQESRQVEPVAYVKGYSKGRCIIEAVDPDWLLPTGMALYRSPPTSQESRQVEPVAWLIEAYDIYEKCTLQRLVFDKPKNMQGVKITAYYIAPPKREPLKEEEMWEVIGSLADTRLAGPLEKLIRATERAHGIGGEE